MVERAPRTTETRESSKREEPWSPATSLPVPVPREGIKYRWVRLSTYGTLDPTNMNRKMGEGWTPVKLSDHPEFATSVSTDFDTRIKDTFQVGGLVLCQISVEKAQARANYYNKRAAQQIEAVDAQYLQDQHSKMPKFANRETRISSFGKGEP